MTDLAPIKPKRPGAVQAFDLDATLDLARRLLSSRMLPDAIKTPEQALMIILKGREIGVPPVQALSHINVIQGKPTVSPELMLSLIRQRFPQAVIKFTKLGRDGCEIQAARSKNEDLTTITFDQDDAKAAGLLGKSNWKTYPRAMYRSRAIAEMARTIFPDAIAGASYTPEELGATVTVADDGSILDVEHEEATGEGDGKPVEIYLATNLQKAALWTIAKNKGLRDVPVLKALSEAVKAEGVPMGDLAAAVDAWIENQKAQAASSQETPE